MTATPSRTKAKVRIRSSDKADLKSIEVLATQWQEEGSTVGQEVGQFEHYLGESGYLLVAEEDESISAFLAAEEKTERLVIFDTEDPYIELEELYVVPGKRGQGIGSQLVNELKAMADTKGICRFHVFSSSRELDRVISFYRRHGFQVWGMQAYAISAETFPGPQTT